MLTHKTFKEILSYFKDVKDVDKAWRNLTSADLVSKILFRGGTIYCKDEEKAFWLLRTVLEINAHHYIKSEMLLTKFDQGKSNELSKKELQKYEFIHPTVPFMITSYNRRLYDSVIKDCYQFLSNCKLKRAIEIIKSNIDWSPFDPN